MDLQGMAPSSEAGGAASISRRPVDKIAFAIRMKADHVDELVALAQSVALDPSLDQMSRSLGVSRATAWVQEGARPLLTIYMEWKVDPVESLQGFERSPELVAERIRDVLRAGALDPQDAALDATAGSSEGLLDWASGDGTRGADVRCYATVVPAEKAEETRRFMAELRDTPALHDIYSRLRERAGFKRVAVWAEPVREDEVLMIELYESDDLDLSFRHLSESRFEFEQKVRDSMNRALGWTAEAMPTLRQIYDWRA